MNNKSKTTFKKILDYFVKTLNGMAYGLFSTLIIGTIIGTIGTLVNVPAIIHLADLLKTMTGIGIGVGIAWSLQLEGLKLIAAGVAGGIASTLSFGRPGDPFVEYLCAIGAIEVVRLVLRKKTPVDIIIVPLFSAAVAYGLFLLINQPISSMMRAIGNFIQWATTEKPFIMGIIISVVMGMVLTAPISSAAIAISINLGGLAGGAAVVGCCVQMVGFAVMSRKDNNLGTIISVGIGTSMLQFKNILKKPLLWLPTIIVSAILGPLATLVFHVHTDAYGSGMGTSGLVGQFATYSAMGNQLWFWLSVFVLQIALPILLVWLIDLIFRKMGWIQLGDLKI
ncbi:MAG TPA: PTS sugar transporter subunit IIC [Bacilli bacterium]|nr:MAG: hypothetical protein BWY97_00670 [Tenericutes bacterium ADurb.BinA124]HPX84125.1 PTS sugar transporter subunit IIC [Bacilli bacterium]